MRQLCGKSIQVKETSRAKPKPGACCVKDQPVASIFFSYLITTGPVAPTVSHCRPAHPQLPAELMQSKEERKAEILGHWKDFDFYTVKDLQYFNYLYKGLLWLLCKEQTLLEWGQGLKPRQLGGYYYRNAGKN